MGEISNHIEDYIVTYLEAGMEFNADGDVVDNRNRIIKELKSQLMGFRKRDYAESQLRNKSPALADAWDQYQTLLTLARVNK